jgi:hypothetical protein
MSETQAASGVIPPYIPFDTFTGFIEYLKGSAVPSRIDKSAMPSDLPSLVRGQIQSALKFLLLVDSAGTPDPKLRRLVGAYATDKWKEELAGVISDAYVDLVGDTDLDSATQHQLDERFRAYYDSDQMRVKAARFYLTAMTAAGLKFSPHLMARRTNPAPRTRTTNKPPKPPVSSVTQMQDDPVEHAEYINFPIGPNRTIKVPKDLTPDDCVMIKTMIPLLEAYAVRTKKGGDDD